jgi:hypothetical protein
MAKPALPSGQRLKAAKNLYFPRVEDRMLPKKELIQGEFVPFRRLFHWLSHIAPSPQGTPSVLFEVDLRAVAGPEK